MAQPDSKKYQQYLVTFFFVTVSAGRESAWRGRREAHASCSRGRDAPAAQLGEIPSRDLPSPTQA